jgi:hypothetical protein
VEADISTPTDSGLCSHAVSRLTRLARQVERAGVRTRTRVRDRRRSIAKRIRAISGQRGRGRESLPAIDRLTGEIAHRAKQTVRQVRRLAVELARSGGRRELSAASLLDRLECELQAADQILAQTDLRLAGQRTIPSRRVRWSTRTRDRSIAAAPAARSASATRHGLPTPLRAS